MFYTLDTVFHSLHTVKQGSYTERKINDSGAKAINISGHKHIVFTSINAAKTAQTMLSLHGHQS